MGVDLDDKIVGQVQGLGLDFDDGTEKLVLQVGVIHLQFERVGRAIGNLEMGLHFLGIFVGKNFGGEKGLEGMLILGDCGKQAGDKSKREKEQRGFHGHLKSGKEFSSLPIE